MDIVEKFWLKVERCSNTDTCWNWLVQYLLEMAWDDLVQQRKATALTVLLIKFAGNAEEVRVLHRCGNRLCCNQLTYTDHLNAVYIKRFWNKVAIRN